MVQLTALVLVRLTLDELAYLATYLSSFTSLPILGLQWHLFWLISLSSKFANLCTVNFHLVNVGKLTCGQLSLGKS